MVNFHAAAVRFGKPGLLYIAPLGTPEPADETTAWPAPVAPATIGWVPLGYTDAGSTFTYSTTIDKVEVAEELEPIAYTPTAREAKVDVSLAEVTYRNLNIAFNGGVIAGGGTSWTFEPPDLGAEQRVMLGWDAHPDPTNNDLRFVFRRVLNGGSLNIDNKKGTAKQLIVCSFSLEKPTDGSKILKIMGADTLNPT